MAKVKKNVVVEGLSGRIGNLVFKQYGDKTVVCKWPTHDPNRTPTPGEARQRGRIQEAASKAKAVLATVEGDVYYQAARKRLGKHSAYHTAVYDYFGVPEITAVNRDADHNLLIRVRDNVGVREVRVEMNGEIGLAAPLDEVPSELWRYSVDDWQNSEIKIFAEDWMGNVGEWAILFEDLTYE